jgi:hypothetical protein
MSHRFSNIVDVYTLYVSTRNHTCHSIYNDIAMEFMHNEESN